MSSRLFGHTGWIVGAGPAVVQCAFGRIVVGNHCRHYQESQDSQGHLLHVRIMVRLTATLMSSPSYVNTLSLPSADCRCVKGSAYCETN